MGCYELVVKRSAEKEIRSLPIAIRKRVVNAIEGLASEPRPHNRRSCPGERHTVSASAGTVWFILSKTRS